jgi:Domain of unknown function (DUF1707)/Domain of unknown function (DUF4190)
LTDLRASDADRDAAVERLRTAALEGRLDSDELEQRLSAAYGARWTSELARLTADVTPPPAPVRPPVFVRPTVRTNGFAVASVVCACLWMFWLGSVLAVVFGHVAMRQIERSAGTESGRSAAIVGLALGYLGIAWLVFILAMVVSV